MDARKRSNAHRGGRRDAGKQRAAKDSAPPGSQDELTLDEVIADKPSTKVVREFFREQVDAINERESE